MRVIVGVDGSNHADRALTWACRRAETCGDTVRAVCAWSLGASGEDWKPQPGVKPEAQRYAEQIVRDAVERVQRERPAAKVETVVAEGNPGQVLVDMSADADLLVVGSRGRGQVTGVLLGSVSQHSVHNARCPVTVVR